VRGRSAARARDRGAAGEASLAWIVCCPTLSFDESGGEPPHSKVIPPSENLVVEIDALASWGAASSAPAVAYASKCFWKLGGD
jgi:hypothetical protein